MFGCLLGQIRFMDPDFLSVELVEGTRAITGSKCNKGPSVKTFEPKCNKLFHLSRLMRHVHNVLNMVILT